MRKNIAESGLNTEKRRVLDVGIFQYESKREPKREPKNIISVNHRVHKLYSFFILWQQKAPPMLNRWGYF
jgi:hypothetical protein